MCINFEVNKEIKEYTLHYIKILKHFFLDYYTFLEHNNKKRTIHDNILSRNIFCLLIKFLVVVQNIHLPVLINCIPMSHSQVIFYPEGRFKISLLDNHESLSFSHSIIFHTGREGRDILDKN